MDDPNRALLADAARLLQPLLGELVFVGGCATGLLVSDPAAADVRPTMDVDAIADVASYGEYAALAGRLRAVGLVEDSTEGAPACRWRKVRGAAPDVRRYVSSQIGHLLGTRAFLDALPAFLLPDRASQERHPLLMARLRAIADADRAVV
jgi:hypothetical protein